LSQPSAGHNYNVGRRVVWAFNKHASEYDKRTCARDKTFVQGNAEELGFKDSAFDAVFTVTTLEFLKNYRKAVKETARVTKPNGKILVMMLNPKSEYFRQEIKKPGDYFSGIKHTDPKEIRDYIS